MHQAQPKEGHKIWLTQEADAKSWSSLKHVQPKEGRKELAPREIKFRYRRLDTTIRERAGSSQEGRKRAKDTPGHFSLFLFSLHSYSRCSRQKSSRHGRDESRQESSMGTVKGSPTISIRLFVGYGPSERLRLLVGHALIYLNIYPHTTRSTPRLTSTCRLVRLGGM